MTEIGQDQLIQISVNWIREHSPQARDSRAEILGTTQLLETGILDSLGLVDLLAFLEQTTGNQIDLLELDEKDISTLEGLCKAAKKINQQGNGSYE